MSLRIIDMLQMIQIEGNKNGSRPSLLPKIGHRKSISVWQTGHLVCLCKQPHQCHIEKQKRNGIASPDSRHIAIVIEANHSKRRNHQVKQNQNSVFLIKLLDGHKIMNEDAAKKEKCSQIYGCGSPHIRNRRIFIQAKEHGEPNIQYAQNNQHNVRRKQQAVCPIPHVPVVHQQKEECGRHAEKLHAGERRQCMHWKSGLIGTLIDIFPDMIQNHRYNHRDAHVPKQDNRSSFQHRIQIHPGPHIKDNCHTC